MTGSAASAVEYGRWFAQLVQYALEARDSQVVQREAAVPSACTGCRSLATFVRRLKSTGYWQASEDLDLGPFRAAATNDGFRVSGSFTYPRIRDLTADGTVKRTIPAQPFGYHVDLSWDQGGSTWRVRDYYFQSSR